MINPAACLHKSFFFYEGQIGVLTQNPIFSRISNEYVCHAFRYAWPNFLSKLFHLLAATLAVYYASWSFEVGRLSVWSNMVLAVDFYGDVYQCPWVTLTECDIVTRLAKRKQMKQYILAITSVKPSGFVHLYISNQI